MSRVIAAILRIPDRRTVKSQRRKEIALIGSRIKFVFFIRGADIQKSKADFGTGNRCRPVAANIKTGKQRGILNIGRSINIPGGSPVPVSSRAGSRIRQVGRIVDFALSRIEADGGTAHIQNAVRINRQIGGTTLKGIVINTGIRHRHSSVGTKRELGQGEMGVFHVEQIFSVRFIRIDFQFIVQKHSLAVYDGVGPGIGQFHSRPLRSGMGINLVLKVNRRTARTVGGRKRFFGCCKGVVTENIAVGRDIARIPGITVGNVENFGVFVGNVQIVIEDQFVFQLAEIRYKRVILNRRTGVINHLVTAGRERGSINRK